MGTLRDLPSVPVVARCVVVRAADGTTAISGITPVLYDAVADWCAGRAPSAEPGAEQLLEVVRRDVTVPSPGRTDERGRALLAAFWRRFTDEVLGSTAGGLVRALDVRLDPAESPPLDAHTMVARDAVVVTGPLRRLIDAARHREQDLAVLREASLRARTRAAMVQHALAANRGDPQAAVRAIEQGLGAAGSDDDVVRCRGRQHDLALLLENAASRRVLADELGRLVTSTRRAAHTEPTPARVAKLDEVDGWAVATGEPLFVEEVHRVICELEGVPAPPADACRALLGR